MAEQRLIDAGKLIEKAYWHGGTPSYDKPYPEGHDAVDVEDIENSPTVDAVPVVRCMDCEYGKVSDTKGCVWCTCYGIHKSLNGFCEYGEWKKWKDGEQDGRVD